MFCHNQSLSVICFHPIRNEPETSESWCQVKLWGPAKPLLISLRQRAIPICSTVLPKRNAKSDSGSLSSSLGYLLYFFSFTIDPWIDRINGLNTKSTQYHILRPLHLSK